jgi:hypothetical protein
MGAGREDVAVPRSSMTEINSSAVFMISPENGFSRDRGLVGNDCGWFLE